MKSVRLLAALALTLALAACNLTTPTPKARADAPVTLDPTRSFVQGQLIVGYEDGVDIEKLAAKLGATVHKDWPHLQAALLNLPKGLAVAKAEATASRFRGLRYAHPNRVFWQPVPSSGIDPLEALQSVEISDPQFGKQWMHRQLNTQAAWELGATGKGIRIGIHDTFMDHRHPDLVDNVFYPGYNGFTGELIVPETPHDGVSTHGTAVAGTAAAVGNDIGGRGVAYEASLVPLAINEPETGGLTLGAIVDAALFAADGPDGISPIFGGLNRELPITDTDSAPGVNGYVHIVNMSWGSDVYDQIDKDIMDYMLLHGITLVTSAGNTPTTGFSEPSWFPGLITVAATTPVGGRSIFSNRGKHINVGAPGVDVWTTYTRNCVLVTPDASSCDVNTPEVNYIFISGTSFSSPATAGVVALILDAAAERDAEGNITDIPLGPAQVRRILEETAFRPDDGEGFDEDVGYGIVNAEAAVRAAQDESRWPQAGGNVGVSALLASDESVGVPRVGLTLVPEGDTPGPLKYAQASNGLFFPQGQGLFLEITPGSYRLLAGGPHRATIGLEPDVAETTVTVTPDGFAFLDVPLAVEIFVDPFEPNDTVAEAAVVGVGTTSRGSLYNPDTDEDVDTYAVSVEAGTSYRVNTETVAGSPNTVVRVLGPDGTTVLVENDDNQEFTTDSLLDFTASATGTVYIEVRDFSGGSTPFNLYEIDIATLVGDETEPNGTAEVEGQNIESIDVSGAQDVTLGSALNAAIGPTATDADIFAVDLTAGVTVVADAETVESGAPDTMIGIYNEAGELVAFNDDYTGRESRVTYDVEMTGTFYIFVVSWDAPNNGTTGNYSFSVTEHNNPPVQ